MQAEVSDIKRLECSAHVGVGAEGQNAGLRASDEYVDPCLFDRFTCFGVSDVTSYVRAISRTSTEGARSTGGKLGVPAREG